jgi:hypothetical protein
MTVPYPDLANLLKYRTRQIYGSSPHLASLVGLTVTGIRRRRLQAELSTKLHFWWETVLCLPTKSLHLQRFEAFNAPLPTKADIYSALTVQSDIWLATRSLPLKHTSHLPPLDPDN